MIKLSPVSDTKRQAFRDACKLAKEGKKKLEISSYLTARFLYDSRTAYSLANAAILSVNYGLEAAYEEVGKSFVGDDQVHEKTKTDEHGEKRDGEGVVIED